MTPVTKTRNRVIAAALLLAGVAASLLFPQRVPQSKPPVVKTKVHARAQVEREFILPMEPVRKKQRWVPVVSLRQPSGEGSFAKSKSEAERIFGGCERARSRMLRQTENNTSVSLVLGIEAPTSGEVKTVRARIADIQAGVEPGDRMLFDEWLDRAVKDYDPYGEAGRRFLCVTASEGGRVSLMTGHTDDFDEFIKKFGPAGFTVNMTNFQIWNAGKGIPDRLKPYLRMDGE